jgi:signal transduction histidine kinase
MLEYSKDELLELEVIDVDGSFNIHGFRAKWEQMTRDSLVEFESTHKTKSGRLIPVEIQLRRLTYDDVDYQFSYVMDISERKKIEAERKAMEQKVAEMQKWEIIGTLVSGIAHDFNNILTGILGYINILQLDFPDNTFSKDTFNSIEKLVGRGSNLIKQLIGFARQGKKENNPIDVHEIIAEIEKQIKELGTPQIEIRTELLAPNSIILGDSTQIFQVFLNLTNNARDAMPNGGKISIKTYNCKSDFDDELLTIEISDEGVGIPDEVKKQIFKPFFTTKGDRGGNGLGLAMVHGIVKNHQGSISFESQVNQGTKFIIRFPRFIPI